MGTNYHVWGTAENIIKALLKTAIFHWCGGTTMSNAAVMQNKIYSISTGETGEP